MERLEDYFAPLIERMPPEARPYGVPIIGVAGAISLILALFAVRTIFRLLFRGRHRSRSIDLGPQEDLGSIPAPAEPPGRRRLTVEGLPVRLRLVVVAAVGMSDSVEEKDVPDLLDQVLWG